MARRWLPLNVPTILMNSASLIHWKSVSFKNKHQRSAKILLLNICWPFFYAIKIFILEHQNHSALKFTDCKRRYGMWDSLCHSFSVTCFFSSSLLAVFNWTCVVRNHHGILLSDYFIYFTHIFYYGPFSFNDFKLQTWSIIWQIRFTLLCLVCVILSTARTPLTSHSV